MTYPEPRYSTERPVWQEQDPTGRGVLEPEELTASVRCPESDDPNPMSSMMISLFLACQRECMVTSP